MVDVNTYRLTDLLRGLGGTEAAMAANLVAGARFVLLDQAVQQIGLSSEERGSTSIGVMDPADMRLATKPTRARCGLLMASGSGLFAGPFTR